MTRLVNKLINANARNDQINASAGSDTLNDGAGSDRLFAVSDRDLILILIGNRGADIFALESGQGTIKVKDFDNGSDLLRLTSSLSFDDLRISNNATGTKVVIQNMADGNEVLAILDNVSAADITPIDFTTV